jgi:hypothetical protein
MPRTLQTKVAKSYTLEDGRLIPPHTLYRFVDRNGNGGCWYAKLENALKSWERRT